VAIVVLEASFVFYNFIFLWLMIGQVCTEVGVLWMLSKEVQFLKLSYLALELQVGTC
jgi:hypothetical protein